MLQAKMNKKNCNNSHQIQQEFNRIELAKLEQAKYLLGVGYAHRITKRET